MKVAAYTRVSTDAQAGEDRYGIEAQRKDIVDYCNKNEYEIVKWYYDEGESGAKFRKGFDDIMQDLVDAEVVKKEKPFEKVVVAKSDRVARDINIYFYYQGQLIRQGVELVSVTEDFGQFGAFKDILKMFTLTCAQMERENINRRMTAGRVVKASLGGYSGGRPPFGYKAMDKKLVINEEEAKCVRRIFELRGDGIDNMAKIADIVTKEGYRTRQGAIFQNHTIFRILANEMLYKGYYQYGGGKKKTADWIKGVQEPIISESWKPGDKAEIVIDKNDFDSVYGEVLAGRQNNTWAMYTLGMNETYYYKKVKEYKEKHENA